MSQPTRTAPPIRARRARFDLSATPLHWIPRDPYASHLINVLSLVVPVGERWFMTVLRDAAAQIDDERLKAEVKGFVGQESSHSRVHEAVLTYMREHGIETQEYTERLEWFLNEIYGPKKPPPGVPEDWWQAWRVSLVAAAEQMTHALGDWALDAEGLDRDGADAVMLDILRWHGSEEIEHCAVAFDLLEELAGPMRYPMQAAGMVVAFPVLVGLWEMGMQCLTSQDPDYPKHPRTLLDYFVAMARGHAPGEEITNALARYFRPDFHPAAEADFEKAEAYLRTSPGVRPPATA